MRVWFDTEFIEDGHTIDLLSVGMVREDGAEYYAENAEAEFSAANEWVQKHVLPHLTGAGITRADIASQIQDFVGYRPEFWAYFADYDWVVLCQLYGRMIDLPESWPMFCLDVQQLVYLNGSRVMRPPNNDMRVHHALDDAKWCKTYWEWLQ